MSQSNSNSSTNFGSDGNNLNGSFGTVYQTINNNLDYQGTERTRINFGFSNDESSFSGIARTNNNYHTNFNYQSSNRFYLFDKAKNHILIDPNASFNYHKTQNSSLDTVARYNNNSDNSDFILRSDIGLGQGRLENVSDARIILFILEDLKANGFLL